MCRVTTAPMTMCLNGSEISAIMLVTNLLACLALLTPHWGLRLLLAGLLNLCLYEALQNSLWTAELGQYLSSLAKRFLPFLAHGPEAPGDASPSHDRSGSGKKKKKKKLEVTAPLAPATIPPIGVSVHRCPPQTADDDMPEHSWTTGNAANIRVRTPRSGVERC